VVIAFPLIHPSRITPLDWWIISVVLVVAFWLWHDFVVKPSRTIDQLCERADVLEMDKTNEDVRTALDADSTGQRNTF
jgi:hypothetical protein